MPPNKRKIKSEEASQSSSNKTKEIKKNKVVDKWQATKSTMKECFQFLFNNEKFADVHFIVGKDEKQQIIPAHKFILVTRSDVFETMFYGSLAEPGDKIPVPDIEPAALLAFLKFLYTDEVEIDTNIVMFTLYVAKKYNVPALQNHCVKFLKTNWNVDNVFLLLTQAYLFDESELANFCLQMIDTTPVPAFASDFFIDIDLKTLSDVLKRNTLKIHESLLFDAVLRWSEAECKRQGLPIKPKNQRSVLGEAFKLIRFPLMTIEQFVNGPVKSGLLSDKEVVQLVIYLKGDSKQPKPSIPFSNQNRYSGNGVYSTYTYGYASMYNGQRY
ncbi:BTB/POZ domain-containing protein 2-like [Chrysoperla carnea]|uniref:BTB/POZ domain-containing protein 2-like n=1 Tax=Chrysoperla carnea TaxID=189513 RepID=UPI001D07620E|nr:BTB/POZ domain-containing protein 2-like [Chrysoperla carnea]